MKINHEQYLQYLNIINAIGLRKGKADAYGQVFCHLGFEWQCLLCGNKQVILKENLPKHALFHLKEYNLLSFL